MDLFSLVARLTLDSSSYESGLGEASEQASSFGSKIKGAMGTGVAAIGAVTAAAGAVTAAFVKGAGDVAAYGDNIDKASQKLGLSAQAYQEWDAILQHSGSSAEALAVPMRTLRSAAESGKEAFSQLGISQEQVASMSAEELFSATITGLQNIADETERTTIATELFGRGAQEMGALLNTSAEDTEAMRQRVHELGGVMSDESVKAAAAFQDSLQDLETAFSGLKRGLTTDFMPGITMVMDGLTEIFGGDPDSGIAMISEGIDGVLSGMMDRLPMFLDTATAILGALLTAFVDNLPKLIEMGGKMVGQLVAGLIKNIPALVQSIPELVMAIISGLVAAWPDIMEAGRDIVTVIGDGIKGAVNAAKEWGADLIQNFVDGITAKFQALKDTVKNAANVVKSFLGFSEPEQGPLSDFHTYAPDMMKLFAQGIRDNEHLVTDQLNKSFDFGIKTNQMYGMGAMSDSFGGGQQDMVFNVSMELDGAILARKIFRYNKDESVRVGGSLIEV